MPNIGPASKAFRQRAIASPPVISFACAIAEHLTPNVRNGGAVMRRCRR